MRYLPHTEAERRAMLDVIGAPSVDTLFEDVPADLRGGYAFDLPPHQGELEVERALSKLAGENVAAGAVPFFVGAGAYRHHIPASVDHLIQRSEFLTSYTPYQPEIAQGTLQYLFEFQSQVAALTGMEVANASMYDGSTACAEAVVMACRVTGRRKTILAGGLHPHYAATVKTVSGFTDESVVEVNAWPETLDDVIARIDGETAAVVVQSPSVFGTLHDLTTIAEAAHAKGALLIAVLTEVVSLGALKSPGEMGADIVVAEGQSIGNGLNFGGPYLGLFATRQKYIRQMPGRLSGETVDADGRRGFVLTLSAREQHIRREKATSNICTNSGLCCLAFTIHLALLGEAGFTQLAAINHAKAVRLAETLEKIRGVTLATPGFFNEFTLILEKDASAVVEALAAKGVLGGVPGARLWPGKPELSRHLIVAATETVTDSDIDAYAKALKEVL